MNLLILSLIFLGVVGLVSFIVKNYEAKVLRSFRIKYDQAF